MSEVTFLLYLDYTSYHFSKFATFDIKFHYMPTNGMNEGWKKVTGIHLSVFAKTHEQEHQNMGKCPNDSNFCTHFLNVPPVQYTDYLMSY